MAETVRTTTAIDEVLHGAVARGDVPGVVAMAAGDDGVLYEGAAGVREAGTDDPITPDTMMRIASMTKMVTTVAALQLVERGELDLDEAVAKYRPEFAELQILEGFDGDRPRLRPPASQAPSGSSPRTRAAWATGSGTRTSTATSSSRACRTCCPGASRCSSRRSWATGGRSTSTASTPTGSGAWSRRSAASRWPTTSTSTSPGRSA